MREVLRVFSKSLIQFFVSSLHPHSPPPPFKNASGPVCWVSTTFYMNSHPRWGFRAHSPVSGFISTLRTRIGRTVRAHGPRLALVRNTDLSVLGPRDNQRCGWKKALSPERSSDGKSYVAEPPSLCSSYPICLTFHWSRRSVSHSARLKNYPVWAEPLAGLTEFVLCKLPSPSMVPSSFTKEGKLQANGVMLVVATYRPIFGLACSSELEMSACTSWGSLRTWLPLWDPFCCW